MKNYIASKKHISKYLFSKSRAPYTGLTYRSIEEDIEAICKRVSGKLSIHVTPHTFRRTMATSLINNGMPIEEVKELLGHVKLDTTMRYITLSKKKVKASYDKYAS